MGGECSDHILLLPISSIDIYSNSVFWLSSLDDIILPLSRYFSKINTLLTPVYVCLGRICLNHLDISLIVLVDSRVCRCLSSLMSPIFPISVAISSR